MSLSLANLHEYASEHRMWHDTLTLKRGDYLHQAGTTDANIYYVAEGTLRYYVNLEDDLEEQIIRFGYQGDFTTAMDTFLHQGPTMLYAQALRKCTVRVIRPQTYRERYAQDPALQALLGQIMRWMINGQLEREIDLLTNSPEVRYRRVLARSHRLFQEIPAKYIANYLRMSPETLSRIRSQR